MVGINLAETRFRILKIDRTSDSGELNITEVAVSYSVNLCIRLIPSSSELSEADRCFCAKVGEATRFRILKIDRTSDSGELNITEDDMVYNKREMVQLLGSM
jgi:hypothetical protein